MLDRVPEPLGYPRHGGPLHRRFGHIRTLRLHVGAHQAQRVCECGMPESVLRPLRGVLRQGNFRMHHGLRLVRKRRGFREGVRHHAHRMPIGRGAHRAAASAGGDKCGIQIKSGHAVAHHNRPQQIRKDLLHRRALLIFAFSLRSSRQNRCPDFQPICKELHAPPRFAKRALGRVRGPGRGDRRGCKQGLCGAAALGLAGPGARQKRPERSRQARRGLRAISGQSHAKRRVVRCGLFCRVRAALLFGTRVLVSKRCFAPPRTGCRFGNARRFGRAGRFVGVRRFV